VATPPQPETDLSWLEVYAIPLAFGLVLMTLLWNLALLCKVQFSREKQVTKLTFKPYIISFCFLTSQLIESALLEYTNENPAERASIETNDWGLVTLFNDKKHQQWA